MTTTKERPILCNGEMVRAILDGRKTQYRYVVKPQPLEGIDELHGGELRKRSPYILEDYETGVFIGDGFEDDDGNVYRCPYGTPGDKLWVREKYQPHRENGTRYLRYAADQSFVEIANDDRGTADSQWYKITNDQDCMIDRWRPSIHMPKWAARIWLNITAVRVERLREISNLDAKAEGCKASLEVQDADCGPEYTLPFHHLWNSIHGVDNPNAWESNPWVWVVEFERSE